MCLVVDANCISPMFDAGNVRHDDYRPVLDWVVRGNGKLVFGGKTYKKELKKLSSYLGFLAELRRHSKISPICDARVDAAEKNLKSFAPKKFNDTHLSAICDVSGCCLICTQEKRACAYLTDRKYYPIRKRPPKLYKTPRNKGLLCDKNLTACCEPRARGGKALALAIAAVKARNVSNRNLG